MANGNLGKLVSTGGAYQMLSEVPATGVQFATVFINAVNPTSLERNIKIAISTSATPAAYDHIQGLLPLEANGGAYEYPAMIVNPGEKINVWSDEPGVVFSVHGMTQV